MTDQQVRRLGEYALAARATYARRPHDDRLPRVAAQSLISVLREVTR
jgi:hypothetical protein